MPGEHSFEAKNNETHDIILRELTKLDKKVEIGNVMINEIKTDIAILGERTSAHKERVERVENKVEALEDNVSAISGVGRKSAAVGAGGVGGLWVVWEAIKMFIAGGSN
jgi:predicted nuclease with TOPRIM domain